MNKKHDQIMRISTGVFSAMLLFPASVMAAGGGVDAEFGREIAFDSGKGNCLACHMIQGGEFPGNFGPPLIQMKLRYPDREKLRMQVWDASSLNAQSIMPPFGKNGLLTDKEVDAVVDYMYTL